MVKYPNGVRLIKWSHNVEPTADLISQTMAGFGYGVYDLQTVPPWFVRSRHHHDEPEIRAAVHGVITFHFDDFPITIEGGDILFIPAGLSHEVKVHNANSFSAFKGSISGTRSVTELSDGSGSVEDIQRKNV